MGGWSLATLRSLTEREYEVLMDMANTWTKPTEPE
jgi:hypothetical protein